MLNYKESLEIVQKELLQIATEKSPSELYEPIKYILSIGGKRIRPCLAIMAYSMFSDKITPVISPAIGLEVFHNFTLLHDDIMDNASMRRNLETVHVKWNENVAILSGDATMILAYKKIAAAPSEVLPEVLALFNQTALEVCEGQQYDMNFETTPEVSVDEYLNMIRLKTAVLIAASLATGGIVAGTSSKNFNSLYDFGLNIGMAFQLQDDYLDVFAEGNKFGKAIGNDIIANKKTYLLLSALQDENPEIVSRLKAWISKKDFEPSEKIKAVKEIYQTLHIGKKTLQLSQEYFSLGLKNLQQVDVPDLHKTELIDLVRLLMNREH